MKFKDYKLVADYNRWRLFNDCEIYAIVSEEDEDEVYFDVTEKDFYEMVDLGLVNSEGYYYLLNHPTYDQIAEYAKRWGIKWTDTPKNKVTEAQRQAILAFEKALKNLYDNGVSIVRNNDDDSLVFFNGNDVKEFVSYDEKDLYPEAVDITDYAYHDSIGCIIDHAYYPDYGHERVLAILR